MVDMLHASPRRLVSIPTTSWPICPNFCAKFSSARRSMPTVAVKRAHFRITGSLLLANRRLCLSVTGWFASRSATM